MPDSLRNALVQAGIPDPFAQNPGGGKGLQSPSDSVEDTSAAEQIQTEVRWRRAAAVVLAGAGMLSVAVAFCISHKHFDKDFPPGTDWRIAMAKLVCGALVSVAAVWFAYSMLRAAERLLIPRHLYTDSTNVEMVRALSGIEEPARFTAKQILETLKDLKKPLEDVGLVPRLSEPTGKKPGHE